MQSARFTTLHSLNLLTRAPRVGAWGLLGAALALGSQGCKVVDAPNTLEDLMVFGFEHFGDKDDKPLREMFDALMPLIEANAEALDEGYRVSSLSNEVIEAAGVPDPEVEAVIGAMGVVSYRHELVPVIGAATIPNKAEAYEHILEYEVLSDTDRDCFLNQDCETYDLRFRETAKVKILGESTRTMDQAYRWVQPDEGAAFAVVRSLGPDPVEFKTNIASVKQQYSLAVMHVQGDAARRIEAYWAEGELIGIDVPDYYTVETAVKAFGDQAERIDAFLDAHPDGEL